MIILKATVFALFLANVGYFLWARGIAPQGAAVESGQNMAGLKLKLATEVPGLAGSHSAATEVLREDTSDGVSGGVPDAPTDDMTGTLLNSVKRCVSVGPFHDVPEAARAATTLREGGYDPRQRATDGEIWAGVWVYAPKPASTAALDALLAKLRAAGIDDALEMPGPKDVAVISLGLFSEAPRAERRVAELRKLGLKPMVADRKRSGTVYWVDIDLKATDGMLSPADLHGETGHIMRLEVKACPAARPG
jgi:hypothetical protein